MRLLDCLRTRCVAVAAMLVGMPGCAAKPQSASDPPTITLLDLDNKPFEFRPPSFAAITVVVFTRSDCPVSNRYAPEIRRLYEAFHPRGVEFFLIYVDPREQPEAIRRHLREYQYPCPALRDPTHALVTHCDATTTPEAVVFDKNGSQVYRGRVNDLYVELGQPRAEATTRELEDAIESTLLGRPVAMPRTRAIGCRIADLKD